MAGILASDSAVLCSIALQYGVPLDVLRNALMRDPRRKPSGPLGAVLDLLAEETLGRATPLLPRRPPNPLRTDNPMYPSAEPVRLRQARRCGARTRSGQPCSAPAVRGRPRCRKHGCGQAPEHPKASATEIFVTAATRKKAWRCAQVCASWSVKRRHSPGMLCNVAGESGHHPS
jgi:hypothetical protein